MSLQKPWCLAIKQEVTSFYNQTGRKYFSRQPIAIWLKFLFGSLSNIRYRISMCSAILPRFWDVFQL